MGERQFIRVFSKEFLEGFQVFIRIYRRAYTGFGTVYEKVP